LGFVWGFIAPKSLSTAFNFFQISGVIPFISLHLNPSKWGLFWPVLLKCLVTFQKKHAVFLQKTGSFEKHLL
jgi:hypothetical protein